MEEHPVGRLHIHLRTSGCQRLSLRMYDWYVLPIFQRRGTTVSLKHFRHATIARCTCCESDRYNAIGRHVFIANILYTLCITSIKLSILAFYWRLFSVKGRTTIYIVTAMVIAWGIAIVSPQYNRS
jgi:hypothetical protein